MAATRKPHPKKGQIGRLKSRLRAAEDAIAAIHSGKIDGLMVSGELVPVGSAEHGYRVFVEAMDEGAITVAADGTILYSNRGFAELAQVPLETVSGRNVFEFIAESDRPA